MKPTQWVGLITNASPHSIPPGATVDQMNLGTETIGQLTSRGGMRLLNSSVGEAASDIHAYMSGGYFYVVYLSQPDGTMQWKRCPQYDALPSAASEPTLTPTGKQSASSYTQKCKSALEDL